MNRGQHWCAYQLAVAERQKVKMIVNQIKLLSLLEDLRNMQAFSDLRIQAEIFGIWARADTDKPRACQRVRRGKERNIETTRHQAFRQ